METRLTTNESQAAETASGADKSPPTAATLAHLIGDIVLEKKGLDLVVLDIEDVTTIAEFMVIGTGGSNRQVKGMAEEILQSSKAAGARALSVEGLDHGWWVLLDFGGVLVHLMQEEARQFYDLEQMWADGQTVRSTTEPDREPVVDDSTGSRL